MCNPKRKQKHFGLLLLEFYIVLLAWRLNSTVHPLIDLSAVVASASVKINIQLRLSGFIQLSCWCSVHMKDSILENTSNNVARYLQKQSRSSHQVRYTGNLSLRGATTSVCCSFHVMFFIWKRNIQSTFLMTKGSLVLTSGNVPSCVRKPLLTQN